MDGDKEILYGMDENGEEIAFGTGEFPSPGTELNETTSPEETIITNAENSNVENTEDKEYGMDENGEEIAFGTGEFPSPGTESNETESPAQVIEITAESSDPQNELSPDITEITSPNVGDINASGDVSASQVDNSNDMALNESEFDKFINRVEEYIEEASNLITSIQTYVGDLGSNTWCGNDASAFKANVKSFCVPVMNKRFDEFIVKLNAFEQKGKEIQINDSLEA